MSELGIKRVGLIVVLIAALLLVVGLLRWYQPAAYVPSAPLSSLGRATNTPARSEQELLGLIQASSSAATAPSKSYNELLNLLK